VGLILILIEKEILINQWHIRPNILQTYVNPILLLLNL